MTTRITLAILLTTWVVLIVGETAAFLTARQSLLALLDDTLITRANAALQASVGGLNPEEPTVPHGDRYEIRSNEGVVVSESKGEGHVDLRPTLTKKAFETTSDGVRMRTIELRTYASREGKRVPYIITYLRPAAPV